MKIQKILLRVMALLLISNFVFAQEEKTPLNLEKLLLKKSWGFSDQELLKEAEKEGLSLDIHPQTYEKLKKAGFSESTITSFLEIAGNTRKKEPSSWVLALGISQYKDRNIPPLKYCTKDVQAVERYLQQQKIPQEQIKVLLNEDATKENIERVLNTIEKQIVAGSRLYFFISGHGAEDPIDPKKHYFLTYNTEADTMKNAFEMQELKARLTSMELGELIMLLDTCHSGAGKAATQQRDIGGLLKDMVVVERKEMRIAILTSSRNYQKSMELEAYQQGAFTYSILKGLSGEADIDNNGEIEVNELEGFIGLEVRKLTKNYQTPSSEFSKNWKDQTLFGEVSPHLLAGPPKLSIERAKAETKAPFGSSVIYPIEKLKAKNERLYGLSEAVGRIEVKEESGKIKSYGTGILVGEEVMITNYHVLKKEENCKNLELELGYTKPEAKTEKYRCVEVLKYDEQRDYCVIRVEGKPGKKWGYVKEMGKAEKGMRLIAIQHPQGEVKQVSGLEKGEILIVDGEHFAHNCSTKGGSSGSALFSEKGEWIGLHIGKLVKMEANKAFSVKVLESEIENFSRRLRELEEKEGKKALARTYIKRAKVLLESGEIEEMKKGMKLLEKALECDKGNKEAEALKKVFEEAIKEIEKIEERRPRGWGESLWGVCWKGSYVDFTEGEWEKLGSAEQSRLAGEYQKWYAKRDNRGEYEKEFREGGTEIEMVLIPPGKYWRGSGESEVDRDSDEPNTFAPPLI
jgi:V8-like Glu-specific endopeptidase